MVRRLLRVDDLILPERLGALMGQVRHVEVVPMGTAGFSGARHDRLRVLLDDGSERRLVRKVVPLTGSWTAYRTGDTAGREAAPLRETALGAVWEIFWNPYIAFALEEGTVGLLMEDLEPYLLPDGGGRLAEREAGLLLGALAAMHARFWESGALNLSTLAVLPARFRILHPSAGTEELRRGSSHPVFELVRRGWDIALEAVPGRVRAKLLRPPEEIAGDFAQLPQTLLHGDAKLANFAFLPDGHVAAFDWAVMGRGPATLDLGYYLAINSALLSTSKERVIRSYHDLLMRELGRELPAGLWEEMVTAAIVGGAGMLLWSKALALEAGAAGAEADWQWWIDALMQRWG